MNFCFNKEPNMCDIASEIFAVGKSKNEIVQNLSVVYECKRKKCTDSKETCNNILWLNTIFYPFLFCIDDMIPEKTYRSAPFICENYPATFQLTIKKHETQFAVGLVRSYKDCDACTTTCKHDHGYFLRILFDVSNTPGDGKYQYMNCSECKAKAHFSLMHFTLPQLRQTPIDIKCVIWMYEMTCTPNEISEFHRHILKEELKIGIQQNPKLYEEIRYILNMPSHEQILSGREDENTAYKKTLTLQRTFLFSRPLVTFFQCIERNVPYSGLAIEFMLGYIYNGYMHPIEKGECLSLFLQSFTYGLRYLKVLCATFLQENIIEVSPKHNLNDSSTAENRSIFSDIMYDCAVDFPFLLEVIFLANELHSKKLLNFALDYFVLFKENIIKSHDWEKILKRYPSQSRWVLSLTDKKRLNLNKLSLFSIATFL